MMRAALEVWGGVECTYNRVGDQYFDQLHYNGHDRRIEDLDEFARIGITTLRYPFLWERTAPNGVAQADWSWADARLERMKKLGIRPIAGFVHHGSGPRDTDLLDPQFGEKLAEYAGAFAQRYPWVEDYTPINELFTTARFSALYGVWYPHRKDYPSCLRALLNECRGTILSMRRIREVNPRARLIQTDDLGKASSTELLRYQSDFENERRWLGWDLLCGRIVPGHSLYQLFIKNGVRESELAWIAENSCPPDILGVNHYPLSNRHLDERMERYPQWSHGGNAKHAYADVESVRIADAKFIEPEQILKEAWERYKIPIAVTEIHVDATREDQLRWFMEIWHAAERLRDKGVDIRALTAWGLLGHFDWHCLVSRCEGYYESGVYDLRAPRPRPTALATMLKSLSESGKFDHPLLAVPGWWRRPDRIRHPAQIESPEPGSSQSYGNAKHAEFASVRPLVIAGARGTLGHAFARICERRGIPYRLLGRDQMDITKPALVQEVLSDLKPWAVVNATGYVRVDDAENDVERCFQENTLGPENLARACSQLDISLATFSTDLVFDGQSKDPYIESSGVAPLNVYGRSKAESEKRVLQSSSRALIIRTSAFFGPWDKYNFVTVALEKLARGDLFMAPADVRISPTYVPDLVNTVLNLLVDGEKGIWHLANSGEVSWLDFAKEAARGAGFDPSRVIGRPLDSFELIAPRPLYSVLGSERGTLLPPLDKALSKFFDETHWRKHA